MGIGPTLETSRGTNGSLNWVISLTLRRELLTLRLVLTKIGLGGKVLGFLLPITLWTFPNWWIFPLLISRACFRTLTEVGVVKRRL